MGYWPNNWGDEVMLKRVDGQLQVHPLLRVAVVVVPLSIGGLYAWWDVTARAEGNTAKIIEVTETVGEQSKTLTEINTGQAVLKAQFDAKAKTDDEANRRIEAQLNRIIIRLDRTND